MRLDHLLSRETLENRLTRLSASGCEGSARAAPAHLDTCIARDMKVTDMINTNNINSLKQFKVFDGCSHHGQDDSSRSRTYVIRRIEKFSTIQWTIPWGAFLPFGPPCDLEIGRRYQGRTADALAQEVDEGRGKLR